MITLEYLHWHVWEGTNGLLFSNEETKQLLEFESVDECVNHVYLHVDKECARRINKRFKEGK